MKGVPSLLYSLLKGVAISLLTLSLSMISILSFLVSPSGAAFNRIARFWASMILKIAGVKVEASGVENITGSGPYIFISNHQSSFDTPILFKTIPFPFRIVAKRSLFYIPLFGWAMKLSGFISIDRERRQRAIRSLDQAVERTKGGISILVFGEGTRSRDGKLLPFKKGGFVMAIKSGLPVIPITIHGTWKIMKKGTNIIKGGEAKIVFGEPIDTKGYTIEKKEVLMSEVRRKMIENLERSDNE